MNEVFVGVVGASGYSGAVAARILAAHPQLRLAFCTSDRRAGEAAADHLAMPVPGDLRFEPNAAAIALADRAEIVLLATSAEVSADLAPKLIALGKRVVDLSGAFRLGSKDDYARWYRLDHPAPGLLPSPSPASRSPASPGAEPIPSGDAERAHYGLPEVFGAPPPGAKLVANPGCYPTAAILALAPLLKAGLIEGSGIIVDAKSGVTGAGRQAKEEYSFAEIDEDLRAYKILSHQHTPEIAQALGRFGEASVTFTAHLLPIRRGILATCYARPRSGATARAVAECLADAYAGRPFVRAAAPSDATIAKVAGTNLAIVGATADADVVIAVAAIDNLIKGAAGQAVQNVNLLCGLDETSGLAHLHRIAP
jgi:N-acetyl-gamma-glutamyl-phosphate reductase